MSVDNSQSLKYKAALVGKAKDYANPSSFAKNTKIVVPLKYLSNFWRSLEMPLPSCKVHLELNWTKICILSSAGNFEKFQLTDAKLHVAVVTLSTKDNINLTKQLSNGFKKSVYWNRYETIPAKVIEKGKKKYVGYLVHHFRVLIGYFFLLMLLMQVLQIMRQL